MQIIREFHTLKKVFYPRLLSDPTPPQVLAASKSELASSSATELSPISGPLHHRVSLVLENVCLACDLLLRLPDPMHLRLRANPDWEAVLKWGIGLAAETGHLDDSSVKLLSLGSQELGLVERDPAYVNPYRTEKKPAKKFEEPPPPPPKKERLKLKRGPRLAGAEL